MPASLAIRKSFQLSCQDSQHLLATRSQADQFGDNQLSSAPGHGYPVSAVPVAPRVLGLQQRRIRDGKQASKPRTRPYQYRIPCARRASSRQSGVTRQPLAAARRFSTERSWRPRARSLAFSQGKVVQNVTRRPSQQGRPRDHTDKRSAAPGGETTAAGRVSSTPSHTAQ